MHGRTPITIPSLFWRRSAPTDQQSSDTNVSREETGYAEGATESRETTSPNEIEISQKVGKSKGMKDDEKENLSNARNDSITSSSPQFLTSLLSRRRYSKDSPREPSMIACRHRFRQTLKPKKPKEPPLPSEVSRKGLEGIITIEVGPLPKRYYVHRDFLMHHSGYFRKALDGPWKEAEDRLVTLSDVEVAPFNVFVHYVYTQFVPKDTTEWVKISQANKWKIEVMELKVLVLADRFIMPEFARAVNNDLVTSRLNHAPYYELVIHAFENPAEGSSVFSLLVDTHCLHWEPNTDEGDEEEMRLRPDLPNGFLVRVMIKYAELKGDEKGTMKKLNPCDYHLHDDDEEKERCGK